MQAPSQASPIKNAQELSSDRIARDSKKLILLFVLFVIALSTLSSLVYLWTKQREIELVKQNLTAIADLKQKQIEDWMAELRRDAEMLTSQGLLAYSVEQWIKEARPNNQAETRISKRLALIQKVYALKSIQLLNKEGQVLLALGRDFPPPAKPIIQQVLQSRVALVTDMHLADDGEPGVIHIDVIAPLVIEKSGESQPVGLLAYHINLGDYLFPLIQSWPTPSATAETLLVRREGDDVVYLNELRHKKDTALKMRIPMSSELPAVRAVRGETGLVEGLDYRGISVLGDLRKIPGTEWFMISKQDLDEIYRPVRLAGWMAAFVALGLITVFGLIFRLWYVRRVARYALTITQSKLKSANLEVRFASLLRQANDIILLMTENGVILDANEKAFQQFARSRNELIGMDAWELLADKNLNSSVSPLFQLSSDREGGSKEIVHRRADGNLSYLEVNITAIESEGETYLQAIIRDVSERKKSLAALADSEERLRVSQEYGGIGTWEVDLISKREIWSPVCVTMLGFPDLEQPTWDDFIGAIYPDDRQKIADAFEAHCELQSKYDIEYRIVDTHGLIRWMRSTGQVEKDPFGKPIRARGVVQDINERKLAQIQLQTSENRFRSFMNHSPVFAWLKDKEGRYTYFNQTYLEKVGLQLEACLGKTDFELWPEESARQFWENDRKVLDSWMPMETLEHALIGEGKLSYWMIFKFPFENAEGESFIGGVGIDVTERMQAEADLREREAKYRGVIESQADGFWLADIEGKLLEVNDAYVRQSGYSREELLTMRVFDLEAKEAPEETAVHVANIIKKGEDLFETLHRRKDGTVWQVEINVSYLPIAEGRVCVFLRDIRQRKRAESLWRTRMELSEMARSGSLDDLLQHMLDSTELFTSSRIGFFHFVASDQENLILQTWSTNTLNNMCKAEGKGQHYPISEAGVWVDCVYQRAPVIHNDYASLGHKKGLPEGHAPVIRLLTVPVIRNGKIVAIVGVGNKPIDYDQVDVDMARDLAELIMDLVQRKHTEQQLHLAASVFANTQEGIIITDPKAKILDVNPAFTQLTGFAHEEVLGKNPSLFKSGRQNAELYSAIRRNLMEYGLWRGEIWGQRKDGEDFPGWMSISAVTNDSGNITHFIAAFSDITLLKQHEQRLEYMAYFDPLTGIPNRVLLADRMRQAIAQTHRYGGMLAVGYLDLDGFKPINDHFGHEAGDQVLIEISQRIKGALREGDTVARLGGDEFVVLLMGLEKTDECHLTMRRLLAVIAQPLMLQNQRLELSASIGVSLFPTDDADADTLLRHSDQAMYQAKQLGKNRFHLYDPLADSQTRAHYERLVQIEAAIEKREFVLFYQPKVDLRSGHVVGVEALIRWNRPGWGTTLPKDFLPLIEEHVLGQKIDQWAIEESLRQLFEWEAMGLDLKVSINITAQSLQTDGFSQNLADQLALFPPIQTGRYELEILESTALDDIEYIVQVMRNCQKLGICFALDDFGTGYSSLTYLKHLPAEFIKIDQTFVRDMLEDSEDFAIIKGVIGLARAFHRQVVAEGVETVEQGVQLIRLGCDLAQGYVIGRPMPANDIPHWCKQWKPPTEWIMK